MDGMNQKGCGRRWVRRLARFVTGWVLFALVVCTVPAWWFRRGADVWWRGDAALQRALADTVDRKIIQTGITSGDFNTGHATFNGEWLFGSYMMAGMGMGQLAIQHREYRAWAIERMEACVDRIVAQETRRFDSGEWRRDPLEALGSDQDHAAYLGYLNLVLSFDRLLNPATRHAALNDRVTAHLVARIEATPTMMLQTYPGETFPVDNCAVIASIALHERATGARHGGLVKRWIANCAAKFRDAKSGLLIQAALTDGRPADDPRGSGTAFGGYFLSFADADFSASLYTALRTHLAGSVLGFGAVREYPKWIDGRGDIDSGPILFGYGVSATGFSLAGARQYGDRDLFSRLYASAALAGAPLRRDDAFEFVTGGPLGNAILFAMLTAVPPEDLPLGALGEEPQ